MRKPVPLRLLADLNISVKTVATLQSLGIDIIRVDKSISTDEEIVDLAKKQGRAILTFDKDFGEIYYFHQEKRITIFVLYLEDQTTESVIRTLKPFFAEIKIDEVKGKLVIVYSGRYRIIG